MCLSLPFVLGSMRRVDSKSLPGGAGGDSSGQKTRIQMPFGWEVADITDDVRDAVVKLYTFGTDTWLSPWIGGRFRGRRPHRVPFYCKKSPTICSLG